MNHEVSSYVVNYLLQPLQVQISSVCCRCWHSCTSEYFSVIYFLYDSQLQIFIPCHVYYLHIDQNFCVITYGVNIPAHKLKSSGHIKILDLGHPVGTLTDSVGLIYVQIFV